MFGLENKTKNKVCIVTNEICLSKRIHLFALKMWQDPPMKLAPHESTSRICGPRQLDRKVSVGRILLCVFLNTSASSNNSTQHYTNFKCLLF